MSTRYVALFAVATLVALLSLSRLLRRALRLDPATPNAAWRLAEAGNALGVVLVATSVVKHGLTGQGFVRDLRWVASYGALGLALVVVIGTLTTRLLLQSRLRAELDRDNAAAGLAAGAHYAATGVLAAPAVSGATNLQGLGLSMVFFVLALAAHAGFVALFRALTTYDDAEQIAGENTAAALSYAGVSLAVAVLVARGVEGDFTTWGASLRGFGGVVAFALALYPVRQLLVQGLLLGRAPTLRGGAIDQAILERHDAGVAGLEASVYVAAALAVAGLA